MKDLKEMLDLSTAANPIHAESLPPIDLYVDQVLTLIAQQNGNDSFSEDRPLSKMMVNNYSKAGLIKPIKGKKYSKEHIIQMMLIFYLKGILSIGDIKRILDGVYSDESFDGEKLIAAYDRFLDIKSNEGKMCSKIIESFADKNSLDPENTEEFLIMLMSLVSLCDCLKGCALQMIESKYPPIIKEEKPKEKKSKKEAEQ